MNPNCSQCIECQGRGQPHHWVAKMDDKGGPIWGCKHCDFTMPWESDDPAADCRAFVVRGLGAWMESQKKGNT